MINPLLRCLQKLFKKVLLPEMSFVLGVEDQLMEIKEEPGTSEPSSSTLPTDLSVR